MLVLADDWNGAWTQLDGDAEMLHMPEESEGLVEYFRCISGEHSDGNEYRKATAIQQTDTPLRNSELRVREAIRPSRRRLRRT